MELMHAGCTGDPLELGQSGQCAILMEQKEKLVLGQPYHLVMNTQTFWQRKSQRL